MTPDTSVGERDVPWTWMDGRPRRGTKDVNDDPPQPASKLACWRTILNPDLGEPELKIWFDTEFIEDGSTIDLISIGMIREDGAEYYAETDQWIPGKASQWVKDNVIAHLQGGDAIRPRDIIAREIEEFAGEKPEFWGYYADYDWVALCWLFGTMMQLPRHWPKYCRDIKQLCDSLGNPSLPIQGKSEHHALADARWNRIAYEFLLSDRSATTETT